MEKYPLRFRLANKVYQRNFPIYRTFYFLYKRLSDRELIASLKKTIGPGMIVLDVGANVGFYTSLFARLVGEKGHVHAFEPDETNYGHLRSYAGCMKNVTLNKTAIGEETKRIRLYLSDELNVDHHTYDAGEKRSWEEVDCLSIDDYFKSGETVDFIKIDTQGYDYFAVYGMRETIARSGRLTLMGEYWPYGLKKAGVDPGDYLKLLKELGFDLKLPDDETLRRRQDDRLFYTTFFAYKD